MSIAYPDSIDDDVKAALDAALTEVFETTIPDPHERGELSFDGSVDVKAASGGTYVVEYVWPHDFQKYLDATDAGDNYLDTDEDDHAANPSMVFYHALRESGIPIPESDPKNGVILDRENGTVTIQARFSPDDVDYSGGDA